MAWIDKVRIFNSEDKEIFTDDAPAKVEVVGGAVGGGNSMRFLFGDADPTQADGQPGDVFLNVSTGDIFENQNGSWVKQGNLKGPQGERGPQGPEGPAGADGFPTEAQWNELVSKVGDLEDRVDALDGGA